MRLQLEFVQTGSADLRKDALLSYVTENLDKNSDHPEADLDRIVTRWANLCDYECQKEDTNHYRLTPWGQAAQYYDLVILS